VDGLPEEVWCGVLDYLTLRERRCVMASCVTLWKGRSQWDITLMQTHTVHEAVESTLPPSIWQGLGGACIIICNMGPHATDEFLKHCGTVFPSLQHLQMVNSQTITDKGLWDLSLTTTTTHPLKSLDITYCRNTTYGGTFCLRKDPSQQDTSSNHGILIRRQPSCLDGRFVTPFQDGREGQEIHTYWADGSFSFERTSQSEGFVCDLWPWSDDVNDSTAMGISATYRKNDHTNENDYHYENKEDPHQHHGHLFLGDKLQFNNVRVPPSWPDHSALFFRPGVSLLLCNDDRGERSIWVSQCLHGCLPPRNFPKRHHTALVPLGQSAYFSREGDILWNNHSSHENGGNDDNHNEETWRSRRFFLLSRMRVLPLSSPMPPQDLVERNRIVCDHLKDIHGMIDASQLEHAIHTHLYRGASPPN